MSIWRVVVSTVILATAACADAPVLPSGESTVEQATGFPPNCAPGDTLTWTEQTGTCGQCVLRGKIGTPFAVYAACASDIDGTTKLIRTDCIACLID